MLLFTTHKKICTVIVIIFTIVLPSFLLPFQEKERRKRLQELEVRRSNRITFKMKEKMEQVNTFTLYQRIPNLNEKDHNGENCRKKEKLLVTSIFSSFLLLVPHKSEKEYVPV